MRRDHRLQLVRQVLRDTPDGMTVAQLAQVAGTDKTHAHRIVNKMPDAYIDRWQKSGAHLSAVWCVVVPPENCPRPEPKKPSPSGRPIGRPRKEKTHAR